MKRDATTERTAAPWAADRKRIGLRSRDSRKVTNVLKRMQFAITCILVSPPVPKLAVDILVLALVAGLEKIYPNNGFRSYPCWWTLLAGRCACINSRTARLPRLAYPYKPASFRPPRPSRPSASSSCLAAQARLQTPPVAQNPLHAAIGTHEQ